MTKTIRKIAPLLTVSALLISASSSAPFAFASAGSTDGVVSVLLKKYKLTETTADKSQITRDGTELSLKQSGVYSFALKQPKISGLSFRSLADPRLYGQVDNKVVDGQVQKQSSALSVNCSTTHCHVFQTGDKVYVTKIESKNDSSNDILKFTIISAENIDGGEGAERFGATVSFKLKKGVLTESSPEDVETIVEAVLAPADDSDNSKQDTTASNNAAPAQSAAPAPKAVPAPPPPAAAPASLSIGETSSQVLQAYGMPGKIIDLGKKKTYIYKDIKVVFTDDKVSDLQPQ